MAVHLWWTSPHGTCRGSGCEWGPRVGALQMVPGRQPQGMERQRAQGLQRAALTGVGRSAPPLSPLVPPSLLHSPTAPATSFPSFLPATASAPSTHLPPFSPSTAQSIPLGPSHRPSTSHPTFSYPPIRLPAHSAPSHLYVPQHLITPPPQTPWPH